MIFLLTFFLSLCLSKVLHEDEDRNVELNLREGQKNVYLEPGYVGLSLFDNQSLLVGFDLTL